MSQENIELVRRAFDDWNRGVREIRADDVDPEMELHSRMIGRVLRGVDGLRTWFTEIDEQFDSWRLQIDPPSAAPRRGTSPRPGEEASRYS